MAHHEDSHDDHGHDMTEGNRQYYPKGWYLPLVGLFVVAFFFAFGGGALLGISGTDKWGKTEVCTDGHCDGHCGMDHNAAMEGEHTDGDHSTTPVDQIKDGTHHDDSVAVAVAPAADCTADDSVAVKHVEGEHK